MSDKIFKNKKGRSKKIQTHKNSKGFIQIILAVVVTLVLIKYLYNIDVIGFLTTGKPREWLDWVYSLSSQIWSKYGDTLIKAWNYVFKFLKDLLDKIR